MTSLAIVLGALAMICSVVAALNIKPTVSILDTLAAGPFAGREKFSDRGWHFRNASYWLGSAAVLVFTLKVLGVV